MRISILAGRVFTCREAFPIELRSEVVAVARKGEASIAQVAKDFGVSESCLQRWLELADIEDGKRPGVTASEGVELREGSVYSIRRTRSCGVRLRICLRPDDLLASVVTTDGRGVTSP